MNSKFSIVKSVVVAAALAAGVSAIARADDSSMGRFGGDSYSYFNSAPVNNAPSTWQANNSNGLSERELQALSSDAPAWHQPDRPATSALASTNDAAARTGSSREPLGARIARFFHVTPRDQATLR